MSPQPRAGGDQPPEPPEAPPVAPASPDEPEWSVKLRESIEALPGKLKAFVSDDDKRGIAEHVHGLFERSGAFHPPEKDPETPPADEPPGPPPKPDRPPREGKDSIAYRLFGPH